MAALLLLSGPQAGRRHEVDGEVFIGRSPSCTIALEDAKVSRRHVRLVIEDGQAKVADLGSRNGTLVNGEKLEGELTLLPGDRLQVGDSTVLFEPSARASLSERDEKELFAAPVEELTPAVGPMAGLYNAGVGLIAATSEAMVLRRAAEELARAVNADKAAAMLGGMDGLLTAVVVGADTVEVSRSMVRGALERKEAARGRGVLCAPVLASGGAPFGIVYAERPEPFGDEELRTIASLGRLTGEALTGLRARVEPGRGPVLVGSCRPFRKAVDAARRAASGNEPVVLVGEPGSGRLQVAAYIHSRSSRGLGPFVVVDARRSTPELEELLFGRTSAPGVPPQASVLLKADGGVLVLRSVEALPRQVAERLGRLLARRTAPARQGGEEPVDLRVMATTAIPLEQLAARAELDAQLVQALKGHVVECLSMKERKADVIQLFEHFCLEQVALTRRPPPTLTPEARRLLTDYDWPGNVGELKGVAERLSLLYAGAEVSALLLPPEIQAGAAGHRRTLAEQVARLERDAIAEALREAKGKKIKAAALLGISRPTLDKKIEDYQLVVEKRRA